MVAVVCGDGNVRVFVLPRLETPRGDQQVQVHQGVVPTFTGGIPGVTCMTCVRWSEHQPTTLLCGASNGSVLMYRVDLAISPSHIQEEVIRPPLRSFMDLGGMTPTGRATISAVAWCHKDPNLFAASGYV